MPVQHCTCPKPEAHHIGFAARSDCPVHGIAEPLITDPDVESFEQLSPPRRRFGIAVVTVASFVALIPIGFIRIAATGIGRSFKDAYRYAGEDIKIVKELWKKW